MVSVAQLDRAADFGSAGWGFESLQARTESCRLCFLETRRYFPNCWIKFCFVRCVVDRQLSFLSGDLKPDSRERLCSWQLFSKTKSHETIRRKSLL
jgi:hypothetical protein